MECIFLTQQSTNPNCMNIGFIFWRCLWMGWKWLSLILCDQSPSSKGQKGVQKSCSGPRAHNPMWDVSNIHITELETRFGCSVSPPQLWFAPASEEPLLPMEMSSDSLMLYSRLPIKGHVHCPGRSAPRSLSVTLRPRDGGSDRSEHVS